MRYGAFGYQKFRTTTHRLAFFLSGRNLLPGQEVCHTCDNPPCANPNHLFAATRSENIRDCVRKGRHFETRKTHCPRGHPFSHDNTLITKSGPQKGKRRCRVCHYDARRIYRQSLKRLA